MPLVTIHSSTLDVPEICPVCLSPGTELIVLRATKRHLMMTHRFHAGVKYCKAHHADYVEPDERARALASRVMARMALVGAVVGPVVSLIAAPGETIIFYILMAISGFSLGGVLGLLVMRLVGQRMRSQAGPATQTARKAIRMDSFELKQGDAGLKVSSVTFDVANADYARRLAEANGGEVAS